MTSPALQTAGRVAVGTLGIVILTVAFAAWAQLAERSGGLGLSQTPTAFVVRLVLWLTTTALGAWLYRLAIAGSGHRVASSRAPETASALVARIAFLATAVAAVVHIFVQRWIAVNHPTNGLYAIALLPTLFFMAGTGMVFYYGSWTAFACSERFRIWRLCAPFGGATLLAALLLVYG